MRFYDIGVSIHTPTQGVTESTRNDKARLFVSIHTPTQGVTHNTTGISTNVSFNPHTHAGCDKNVTIHKFLVFVSIHTPTQGVTNRHRRIHHTWRFQSTHPRRVWLFFCKYSFRSISVSIHTPTQGVTRYIVVNQILLGVSIHTPTQGVTKKINNGVQPQLVSIHTPTQGVTGNNVKYFPGMEFQSTHPRRVWPFHNNSTFARYGFNPHTHAGCDCMWLEYHGRYICFNPHTHAGCDICVKFDCKCLIMFQSTHPRRVWRRLRSMWLLYS